MQLPLHDISIINHRLVFKVDLSKSIAIVATLKMEVTEVLSYIASHSVPCTLGMLLLGGLRACPQENFENLPS